MASPLPHRIQLILQQTLAQWRQWQCQPTLERAPEVVDTLSYGIGNFSVLVDAGQLFVIRIDGINPAANGLSRQTEWRSLLEASRAGLAPRPRYFNPDLGSLVCDYLPHDENQDLRPADVAGLLRAIHRLPARHHRLDLGERVRRYEKMLEHRPEAESANLLAYHDRITGLLRDLERAPTEVALCHNDLLRANRLYSGGKLWALDWEYCAMGSPMYDLAVIIQGDTLDRVEATNLVENYLGRPADSTIQDSLYRYGCVYRYLELLWFLALDKPVHDGASVEEKLVALEAMLA